MLVNFECMQENSEQTQSIVSLGLPHQISKRYDDVLSVNGFNHI